MARLQGRADTHRYCRAATGMCGCRYIFIRRDGLHSVYWRTRPRSALQRRLVVGRSRSHGRSTLQGPVGVHASGWATEWSVPPRGEDEAKGVRDSQVLSWHEAPENSGCHLFAPRKCLALSSALVSQFLWSSFSDGTHSSNQASRRSDAPISSLTLLNGPAEDPLGGPLGHQFGHLGGGFRALALVQPRRVHGRTERECA